MCGLGTRRRVVQSALSGVFPVVVLRRIFYWCYVQHSRQRQPKTQTAVDPTRQTGLEAQQNTDEEGFTAPRAPRLPRRGDQHTAPGPAARRAGQRCPRSRRRAGSCAGRVAGASWPVPCASARVPSPCKGPPALLLYGSPHKSLPYVLENDHVAPGRCSCLFRQVHEMPVT